MSAHDFERQMAQLKEQAGPVRPVALARLLGLMPAGQSDEEFAAAAKRRYERDWQLNQIARAVADMPMATDGPCEDYVCPFSCGWFEPAGGEHAPRGARAQRMKF